MNNRRIIGTRLVDTNGDTLVIKFKNSFSALGVEGTLLRVRDDKVINRAYILGNSKTV